MHRFYLTPKQAQGPLLTLSPTDAHHALHVLRVRVNERVVVLDGAGNELMCEVQSADREDVVLKVIQRQFLPPLPYRITLAQALTKTKTMDLIVQKATELGVHRLVPILSERSVSQIEEGNVASKLEKWHATAVEEIKQCGSPWEPQFGSPKTTQQFLASEPAELTLVASL